jgi:hypothetical protein
VINHVRKDLEVKTERVKVFEEEFEIEYVETIRIRDRAEMFKADTIEYKKRVSELQIKLEKMEN